MQFHSLCRLILLFCTFSAVDAVRCDKSLVTGVPDDQIHFVPAYKSLFCSSGENSLMAIKFGSKLYEFLMCDAALDRAALWNSGTQEEVDVSSLPLAITCVEYCTSHGEGIAVKRISNNALLMKCSDQSQGLYNMNGLIDVPDSLIQCTLQDGWSIATRKPNAQFSMDIFNMGNFDQLLGQSYILGNAHKHFDFKLITNDIMSSQHFVCANAMPCSVVYRQGYHFDNTTNELTCVGESNSIWTTIDSKSTFQSTSLKCTNDGGWLNGDKKIAEANTPLNFFCANTPCSVQPAERIHFDNSTNTLSCTGGGNVVDTITVRYRGYISLTCTEAEGWKDGDNKIDSDVYYTLPATCKKHCTVTGDGIKLNKEGSNSVVVSCTDPAMKLFYKERRVRTRASCDLHDWTINGKELDHDTDEPLQLECRHASPCTVRSPSFDSQTKFDELTCPGSSNNALMAIEYEGSHDYRIRKTSLKCSENEGWKDDDRNLGDAYIPLDVTCVEYCASTGTGIRTIEGSSVTVTCPDDQLYYEDEHMPGGVSCSLDRGWMKKTSDSSFQRETKTAQLECRQVPKSVPPPRDDSSYEGNNANDLSNAICIVISTIALLLTIN